VFHVVPSPQFQSRPEGLFRVTTKGERLTEVQLTNYQAVITATIRLDDGVETKYEFDQQEAEPTARFLNLLQSGLSSGHAHLVDRSGGSPETSARCCGWRQNNSGHWLPLGDCIGWLDRDDIYLDPAAAFRTIQTAARDSGDAFGISEHTLRKRLRDRGLLASVDARRQTLTIRRSVCGSSKDVLHFRRNAILPSEPADALEDVGR
jgi:hypothetical protein